MNEPQITFWTEAPADAPDEIKGTTCYFRPERLEWSVGTRSIRVSAHGPATRVRRRQGFAFWSVEGYFGDERPAWLPVPLDALAAANRAVREIASAAGAALNAEDPS